ncbi:hypothetical protein [Fictibacillus phosphorivorans]|uniref:hypothetical protein n=1 Tax=Fictibacillus phosphorivorans TaxID=1221500 RepID=UPI0011A725D5|nr:hypothetical protein [Fictibacillus phosphorivorans]
MINQNHDRSDPLDSFFFNSFSKSGTHLMFQILTGFPSVKHDPAQHLYMGLPNQIVHHEKAIKRLNKTNSSLVTFFYSKM